VFCPKCRYEYKPGVTTCPDCEVPLVPELPAETEPEFAELVTVLTTSDVSTALLARSLLEEAGISCFLKGHGPMELLGTRSISFVSGSDPGEIQVRADDVSEAVEALADLQEEEPPES